MRGKKPVNFLGVSQLPFGQMEVKASTWSAAVAVAALVVSVPSCFLPTSPHWTQPSYRVVTLAGNGVAGFADGSAKDAAFNLPLGVAVNANGDVYVTDTDNRRIRKISQGIVTTFAGDGTYGDKDGANSSAQISPYGIAIDAAGNLLVSSGHRIRKIQPSGEVTTLAGGKTGTGVISGHADDGQGASASFYTPAGVTIDPQGNVFVADIMDDRIRKVSPSGTVTTLPALIVAPMGVAANQSGDILVVAHDDRSMLGFMPRYYRVFKMTPAGNVSIVAGGVGGFADGPGPEARFDHASGIAIGLNGDIFVADSSNHRIRKIDPNGTVWTVAGDGTAGYKDGAGTDARFNLPEAVAVDSAGRVFVADTYNHRIRMLIPEAQ